MPTKTKNTLNVILKNTVIFISLSFFIVISARHLDELTRPDGTILESFFTPYDNVRQLLISLIDKEQSSINIATYFFTDHAIANALIRAQQRNVTVTVIIDHSMLTNARHNNVLYDLAQHIKLYIFRQMDRGLMHNKFIIFEKNINNAPLGWTGSFNLTHSAQNYNFENVIISNDLHLIERYKNTFSKLLEQSIPAQSIFTVFNQYQSTTKIIQMHVDPLGYCTCTFRKPLINILEAIID